MMKVHLIEMFDTSLGKIVCFKLQNPEDRVHVGDQILVDGTAYTVCDFIHCSGVPRDKELISAVVD